MLFPRSANDFTVVTCNKWIQRQPGWAQEQKWFRWSWKPANPQTAQLARRAEANAGLDTGAFKKAFGEISFTQQHWHLTHCLVYNPLHIMPLFRERTFFRSLRKAKIKSTHHKFLLLETNSQKTFFKNTVCQMFWVLTKCQDGGVLNYLVEQEASQRMRDAGVLCSRWIVGKFSILKMGSVLYLFRFIQHLMLTALMWPSNAKGKQKNKRKKNSSLSIFPSYSPDPGLPSRPPPALLASFCHCC